MNEPLFILHHYEQSPFAEKIRAMMGLTEQTWGSVLSPPFPPRPNVDPLAGGYRRIPVAQLGADVFCDTALIAQEVASLTGKAELAPVVKTPEAVELVGRAEGGVFFSAIAAVPPASLLANLVSSLGPLGALRFVRDRMGMMRRATVELPNGAAAKEILGTFIADVDDRLEDRDSIDEGLGYADFCVYHPLWLARNVGGEGAIEGHEALMRWMDRMEGLGQGERVELSPKDAFSAAVDAEPRALPTEGQAHELLGEDVQVAPVDYGTVPVRGALVGVTSDRVILARETKRFGTLHVHFPRDGYPVERA